MLRLSLYCLFLGALVFGLSGRKFPTTMFVQVEQMTVQQAFAGVEVPAELKSQFTSIDQGLAAMEEYRKMSQDEKIQVRGLSSVDTAANFSN